MKKKKRKRTKPQLLLMKSCILMITLHPSPHKGYLLSRHF
uniref:Uncharacterized protein n=1 Tax=Rhizophora mucronata TaxID=61149 RepID=A0A2P2N3Q1_RHIMU